MRNLLFAGFISSSFLIACVGDSPSPTTNDAGSDDAALDTSSPGVDGGSDVGNPTCTNVNFQTDSKNCGTCGHDCLGGACTAGVCQPVALAAGQTYVMNIVATATKVFWVRSRTNTQASGVYSVDLDGKNLTPIYEPGPAVYCGSLDVSATDVYFGCDGQIDRCAQGGCGAGPTPLVTIAGLTGLAFDATNDRVYFSILTPYNSQAGGFIGSVAKAGGAYARLTAADQPNPGGLVIDKGTVYWLDSGTYINDNWALNGGIRKAPLGTNQAVTVVANDQSGGDFGGIALAGNSVYWSGPTNSNLNQIHTVSTAGGSASNYTSSVTKGYIRSVMADASYVYWSEDNSGIYRCEQNCIKPTLIVGNQATNALAQDAKSIFWAAPSGEIRRLAK